MKKKLIEVAPFLPLDAISTASKADKDKKTGTIKNVHKWFAPMPTPALRAAIFAALVDAPEDEDRKAELLKLVERLVPSDGNPPDTKTLDEARAEVRRCCGDPLPTVFDPFCGGGSTLIEAQRLGLPAMGSDLNPVPVLITRTLTELIPQVAGRPPLADDPAQLGTMTGGPLDGLLADVKHYAEVVRQQVWHEVGDLYPKGPDGETIIAWLWAWTVTCPNPACGAQMPLVTSLALSKRKGALRSLEPRRHRSGAEFRVVEGAPSGEGSVSRAGATCYSCGRTFKLEDIRPLAAADGLRRQLLCAATDDGIKRSFVDADLITVPGADDPGTASVELPKQALGFRVQAYGMTEQRDLYTDRQGATLSAFARAIAGVPEGVEADGGDEVYAKTIASILGLAVGKLAQSNSTQVRWNVRSTGSSKAEPAFGRHALPMVWDFAETNPFGGSVGDWIGQVKSVESGLAALPPTLTPGRVVQSDARSASSTVKHPVLIVTDPPYFDQIGYADLSDYFYVWHRLALRRVHPDLYGTITTPKDAELIATPYRHDGEKDKATRAFIDGFTETFESLKAAANDTYPVVIVYAHRQEEKSSLGTASTGWDAMLDAVLRAGLMIEATLPVHGSYKAKLISIGTNALASYIVMVCRPRPEHTAPATLAEFRSILRRRLPDAVAKLLASGESMVDIRHAAIGPGLEVLSQYSQVFDGNDPIPVRRALSIINEELGRLLDENLGVVDDETRWACQWYAERGFGLGDYGEALKGAQSFGLGVDGLVHAGIVESGQGLVRLLRREELPPAWWGDDRTPVWEACQHLTKRLTVGRDASDRAAGELLAKLGEKATGARELAQYLTNLAIEKGWSDDAIAYDALVKSWPRIEEIANDPALHPGSGQLFTM